MFFNKKVKIQNAFKGVVRLSCLENSDRRELKLKLLNMTVKDTASAEPVSRLRSIPLIGKLF